VGANSGISWCDATWNVVAGCERTSPGCANCWAVRDTWRLAHNPNPKVSAPNAGLVDRRNGHLDWTGEVRCLPERLTEPMAWKKPKRIFVASRGDLFHPSVPFAFINDVFSVMLRSPLHTYLVLTKRADRMQEYASYAGHLRNVWLGVTIENQQTAEERIPLLLQTPAAVRWVSAEPLLGPVDLRGLWDHCPEHDFPGGFCLGPCSSRRHLDWVVCGGESGPKARPMHPDWARGLRDQCREAEVPFFFKQWGIGTKAAGHLLDGVEHHEFPEVTP
jgi:protein gp37